MIVSETTPWDAADYLTTEQDRNAYLDAARAEHDPQLLAAAQEDVARATAGKAKVLLIEDDERMIDIIEEYLAPAAVVTVARSKASAYAVLNDDYCLVISDLSIPSQDGSLDATVDNGIAVLSEIDGAARCSTVFVFSGQINATQLVACTSATANVGARMFSKAELPEMLNAATQTTTAEPR